MKFYLSPLALSMMLNFSAAAEPVNKDRRGEILLNASNGCQILESPSCSGKYFSVQAESKYRLRIEKFVDSVSKIPFSETYSAMPVFNAALDMSSHQRLSGGSIQLGRSFYPTEKMRLDADLYIGHVKGEIDADVGATVQLSIPKTSVSLPNGQVREIPATISKLDKKFSYNFDGKTYYGGLKLAVAYEVLKFGNFGMVASQSLSAGLEKVKLGTGLSAVYSSEADQNLGLRSSAICSNGVFRSAAKYAFIVSACLDKVKKDRVYDEAYKKAVVLSGEVNAYMDSNQATLEKVSAQTGVKYAVPGTTPDTIMGALGMVDPYQNIQSSVVVGASVKIDKAHLTIVRKQPVGRNLQSATTNVALSYDF